VSVRPIARAGALLALACALLLTAGPAPAAPVEEVLLPLDRYNTEKSRALASQYRPQLVSFYETIYHCIPWVDLQKNGIGFRTPRWATEDDRYLSVWIWIDQNDEGGFAALSQERRASAMLSRYGVDLLRRMTALGGLASDGNLQGFSVVLSWIKPGTLGRAGQPPVNETVALFADRASILEFLANRLPGAEFLNRARFSMYDGQQDLGRLPLEIWDDPFLRTFKLKNYQPPKNVHCS
jgi:hypothetical protein